MDQTSNALRETVFTPLEPHGVIPLELTDAALADPNGYYRSGIREALLRLPAAWRQVALEKRAEGSNRLADKGAPTHRDLARRVPLTDIVDEILQYLQDEPARPRQMP